MAKPAGRVTVVEGRRTLVVERQPPLPRRLGDLLAGLFIYPIRISGWRSDCSNQSHRFTLLADGSFVCSDGIRRDLRVMMCRDCEAAEVHDVSIDRLREGRGIIARVRPSSLAPRRIDHIIGRYSGARRFQREYRGA